MIRAIGFNQGLRGDLCMSTVAARSFKQQYPDSHLTLGINQRFKDLAPLFHDHPYFDAVHVYRTYDGWPGREDLQYLKAANYDLVFNAMPQHHDDRWHQSHHQYAEACRMCGLSVPDDLRPVMTRWFTLDAAHRSDIAFAPFGGNGERNEKALSVVQAQEVVDRLDAEGYRVVHLGAPDEPRLERAVRFAGSYFDAVRVMLSCRLLVHCDTGMGHFAGAYNHPSFGLYGYNYYGPDKVRNIQPLHERFAHYDAPAIPQVKVDEFWPQLASHCKKLPHD